MAQMFFDAEAKQNPRMKAEELKNRATGRAQTETILLLAAKHDASYWLGLTQYEQKNYRGAIDYFERRTLAVTAESPWLPGARYNLARSHEASGELDKAVAVYRETGKQLGDPGLTLRARWIEAARPKPAAPPSAEPVKPGLPNPSPTPQVPKAKQTTHNKGAKDRLTPLFMGRLCLGSPCERMPIELKS
jgi:hypothetical protein